MCVCVLTHLFDMDLSIEYQSAAQAMTCAMPVPISCSTMMNWAIHLHTTHAAPHRLGCMHACKGYQSHTSTGAQRRSGSSRDMRPH